MKRALSQALPLSMVLLGLTLADAHARYEGESSDRMADWIALESQEQALARTERLLREPSTRDSRPVVLWRAAEQLSKVASLHSRIAHAFPKQAVERNRASKSALTRSVQRLSELLSLPVAISSVELRIRALALRANQSLELAQKLQAESDFRAVIQGAPDSEEAASARLALSSIFAERQQYEAVIEILRPLRESSGDPRQGLALYRSAWAAFNLTHFEQALGWVKTHTEVLKNAEAGTSDQVIRENLLLDAAVFYAEAIERNDSCCRMEDALERFQRVGAGSTLAKVGLRFGKLLRSHRRVSELKGLSQQFLTQLPTHAESLEVLILILEDSMNHHRFADLSDTASRISAHTRSHPAAFSRAIVPMSETLEQLTVLAQKNKEATEAKTLFVAHAELSQALLRMLPAQDPRVAKVQFQLGETFFRLENYAAAALAYRAAFQGTPDTEASQSLRSQANVHALGAQFKVLAERYPALAEGKIPSLDLRKLPEARTIPAELGEIATALDAHPRTRIHEVLGFARELHKALLAHGEWKTVASRSLAIGRLLEESKSREEFLSLGIDLLISQKQWASLVTEVRALQKLASPLTATFVQKLQQLEGDAAYELVLGAADSPVETQITRLKSFRNEYKQHPKADIAWVREAELLDKSGQPTLATALWEQISKLPETSLARGAAHRHRIDAAIQARNVLAAAEEELRFARWLQVQKIPGLNSSLLHVAELTFQLNDGEPQKAELLRRLRTETPLCTTWTQETVEACLILSTSPTQDAEKAKPFKLSAQARTFVALAELKERLKVREKQFHGRFIESVQEVFSGWGSLPIFVSKALEAEWTPILIPLFERHRTHLREQRRIEADEWAIKRRARAIQDAEKVLALSGALGKGSPLARAAIRWAAELHQDAAADLRAIRKPKGMSPSESAQFDSQIEKLAAPFQERSKVLSQLSLSTEAETSEAL